MTVGIRPVLTGLALAFSLYLAVGALMWPEPPEHPGVLVTAVLLFLVVSTACILWGTRGADAEGARRATRLPWWLVAVALAAAVVVPALSWFAVAPESRIDPVATRSIGEVGAIMTIVVVRGRPWAAWAGVALLSVVSIAAIGPGQALARGLLGAFIWVGTAQLIVSLVRRAERDAAELTALQRAVSERLASHEAAQRQRRALVRRALSIAGPVLTRAVQMAGRLDPEERTAALIAEETLRDELRGSRLLDDDVRAELAAARRRGAEVSVLDEGGLEDLDEQRLAAVRAELVDTLARTTAGRLWVRTSTHPDIAVTVVGRDGDADDDDVALWHEIAR
ncbi:hypothetical protein [Microbacterium sp. No. 7]|uniref:hypothetical protein n=1 Tax=Microbacterium sp. No. 7 TaxID=1714373 RepID=UPI0006D0F2C5|nr:hypothetical protein [Microbacterium sp. No. 7]ALJ19365.1 hypothetical protein AOA12_05380 [Microbacterium sp. No. 7]